MKFCSMRRKEREYCKVKMSYLTINYQYSTSALLRVNFLMFYGMHILSKNLGANSKFQVPDRLHEVPYWGTTAQNEVAWNLCTPGLRT
jgi:hypothetical protein